MHLRSYCFRMACQRTHRSRSADNSLPKDRYQEEHNPDDRQFRFQGDRLPIDVCKRPDIATKYTCVAESPLAIGLSLLIWLKKRVITSLCSRPVPGTLQCAAGHSPPNRIYVIGYVNYIAPWAWLLAIYVFPRVICYFISTLQSQLHPMVTFAPRLWLYLTGSLFFCTIHFLLHQCLRSRHLLRRLGYLHQVHHPYFNRNLNFNSKYH